MEANLVTIRELLRDPQFREYFTKPPKLPDIYTPERMPWKLYVLKKGETKWRAKRFGTYKDAFEGFKKMLPLIENASINCPTLGFMPPIRNVRVKGKYRVVQGGHKKQVIKTIVWGLKGVQDEEHHWCSHCRRPTIFRFATSRIMVKDGFTIPADEPAMRCVICGASERIVDLRNPLNAQRWDVNRPKIYEL